VNRLSVMGTDYFDYDLVGTLAPYLNRKAGDNQFNQVNGAGTTQGSLDYQYGWYDPSPDHLYMFNYDTQRQKYVNQDPNLLEYMLERTEGGEWYNYTRIFHSTNYYNVYLRHACELTQPVSLDLIGAEPTTNNLGTFYCTNAFAKSNYRYAPLRDGSGNLAVVHLSGTNTLRLTIASPQGDSTKQGLSLNYMAFVPASVPALVVLSSSQAGTGYTLDTTASINQATKTITIPQSRPARYYRLRWDHQVTIKSITLVGGNVVMTYQ
jgi:hypothetical protein